MINTHGITVNDGKGFIYEVLEEDRPDGMRYKLLKDYSWAFPVGKFWSWLLSFLKLKYLANCHVDMKAGMLSDGATWARDLGAPEKGWRKWWARLMAYLMHSPFFSISIAWFIHDRVCYDGFVLNDLGEKIQVPNLAASTIISTILFQEGYKIEPFSWFFATLFGAKDSECYKNGLFKLKGEKA